MNLITILFLPRFKVPYDSLTPLPPDEFKPWTIPYRLQRHMQKYSSFRYTRHYNYRFKFNGQFSTHEYCSALPAIKSEYYDVDANPKEPYAVATQSGPHHNNCYYKLKQYTHLENFRTQTVEYCTMPLTVERDNDQKAQRSSAAALHENPSRAPSRSSVTTTGDGQSKQEYTSGIDDASAQHSDGVMEHYEMDQNGYMPEMHCIYPANPYGGAEEYYSYGYDGNLHQTTLLPANAGGTFYYTCGPGYPPPNNLYIQAPPPMPQPPVITSSATSGASGHTGTYYHPNPFYSSAMLPSTVPQQTYANSPAVITPNVTPSTRGGRGANSLVTSLNGRINWDAKKSMKSNGMDLPADVATLRYFYNLGLEYHNKHLKQNAAEGTIEDLCFHFFCY